MIHYTEKKLRLNEGKHLNGAKQKHIYIYIYIYIYIIFCYVVMYMQFGAEFRYYVYGQN